MQEIARFEREGVQLETLGLTLAEGKLILKNVQENVIQKQVHESLKRQRCCPDCGKLRQCKGHHDVTFRTLFGNVALKSPRLHHCPCQPHEEKTFNPLQGLLPEHVSPELLYLEVKWGSLLAYAPGCDLLHDVLPVNEKLNAETMRQHLFQVAEQMEGELGDERPCMMVLAPE